MMMFFTIFFSIVLGALLLFIILQYKCPRLKETFQEEKNSPPIFCLMITGKNDERIRLSRESVKNFYTQTYENKHLVIINHHPTLDVIENNNDRVFEFKVKKSPNMTLGMLRNISLMFVPFNAYWIPWDDDDWRSQEYLSILHDELLKNEADALVFTKRYEFNVNTRFSWMIELRSGFPIVLCKNNPIIKYKNIDTMEDTDLIKDMKDIGYKVKVYDNSPGLYIRLVHTNNTSLYVNDNKENVIISRYKNANYVESDIDDDEKKYVIRNVNDLVAAIGK